MKSRTFIDEKTLLWRCEITDGVKMVSVGLDVIQDLTTIHGVDAVHEIVKMVKEQGLDVPEEEFRKVIERMKEAKDTEYFQGRLADALAGKV